MILLNQILILCSIFMSILCPFLTPFSRFTDPFQGFFFLLKSIKFSCLNSFFSSNCRLLWPSFQANFRCQKKSKIYQRWNGSFHTNCAFCNVFMTSSKILRWLEHFSLNDLKKKKKAHMTWAFSYLKLRRHHHHFESQKNWKLLVFVTRNKNFSSCF